MEGEDMAVGQHQTGGGRRRFDLRFKAMLAGIAAVIVLAGIVAVTTLTAAGGHAAARQPLVAARQFSLPELGHPGQKVSLAAVAGRPVIINFFASWCHPCRRETPLLARFYRDHHGKILIIGVDSGDQSAAAMKFVKADGVTYPVAFDPLPASVTISYGVIALPQTFLLNSQHQIVRHIIGDVTQGELDAWASSISAGASGKG